jgi:peptidoglycan/LPS O-acetylase OafA/YrhL
VHGALRIRLAAPGICAAVGALLLTFCSSYVFGQAPLLLNQLIAVFIVFPLLLVTLSNTVPGPRLAALCRFAGNISYPVYILQGPALLLIAAVPQVFFHRKAASWVPAIGIVEVGLVVAFAWWIDAYFDSPVRRLLKTHFLPRRQLSVGAP